MSIVFYLVLLIVVVLGAWLLGRKRSAANADDKRGGSTKLPTVWKEREDSMMKLL